VRSESEAALKAGAAALRKESEAALEARTALVSSPSGKTTRITGRNGGARPSGSRRSGRSASMSYKRSTSRRVHA
jgi:hypothetical protein